MSALHEFDLLLTDYVHANVHGHLGNRRLLAGLNGLDGRLVEYLKTLYRTRPAPVSSLPFLLNDSEMSLLGIAAFDAHVEWLPSAGLHREATACTGEIRRELARAEAERWAEDSAKFSEKLEVEPLQLCDGIQIVREWSRTVRRYLEAMGRTDLIPPPDGGFPTPTHPSPSPIEKPKKDLSDVERMRAAMAKHERKDKASPRALIKAARINNKRGRMALRTLEASGEYHGFEPSNDDRSHEETSP